MGEEQPGPLVTLITMTIGLPAEHRAAPGGKPRARALGLPFAGRPGRWNAVTELLARAGSPGRRR